MRSVKVERKPRSNPRAKTIRKPARGGREAASVQPGSVRGPKNKSRMARAFSRPMLAVWGGLLLLVIVLGLAVTGVMGRVAHTLRSGVSAVVADAGFGVYEIRINGNRRVPINTIMAALGVKPGDSIFTIDLPGARAHIMALDWIASADVVRRYPDAITVTVVEKRPFALWQSPVLANASGGVAVVERSGGVITTQGVDQFSHLPKLIGAGAPQSAADLVDGVIAHRAIAARIAAYERISNRRWNLILSDGVVVQLPEAGWAKQLDDLENLIVDKGILEKDVTEVDLRSPSHYFFILKSGEKKDAGKGKDT
jgi:cell division protein FtsQ